MQLTSLPWRIISSPFGWPSCSCPLKQSGQDIVDVCNGEVLERLKEKSTIASYNVANKRERTLSRDEAVSFKSVEFRQAEHRQWRHRFGHRHPVTREQ